MPFPLLHRRRHSRIARRSLLPGSYLTDGRALFRVAGRLALSRRDALISLEDCRTLEIQVCITDELHLMGLTLVPAPREAEALHNDDRRARELERGPVAYQHNPRVSPAAMKL
jgi:hypothetical protein